MSILVTAENLVKGMVIEVPEDIDGSTLATVERSAPTDDWTSITVILTNGHRTAYAPGDGVEVYNVPVGFHGFA